MKCPKCGSEMIAEIIGSFQPKYKVRCPNCGHIELYLTIYDIPTGSPDCPVQPSSDYKIEQRWDDLRNQAAIAAMHGIINLYGSINYNKETVAKLAVEQADALIAELRKEK